MQVIPESALEQAEQTPDAPGTFVPTLSSDDEDVMDFPEEVDDEANLAALVPGGVEENVVGSDGEEVVVV